MKNANVSAKAAKFREKLSALQEKLLTGENFSETYDFFFDHLGENNEFMHMSKKTKHPAIKKIIGAIGEQLFNKKVTVSHFLLLKFPKTGFYHGACFIDGKMGGIIFFEEIDMGMLSVVKDYPETSFVRFSALRMETDSQVTVSPIRSEMIH